MTFVDNEMNAVGSKRKLYKQINSLVTMDDIFRLQI